MTDEDVHYIGNLILNGTGDGQSSQILSLVPMPRRIIVPNYARLQIRRVEIVRNLVGQQVEAVPGNRITRRLIQVRANVNEHDNRYQRIEHQRRSLSEQRLRGNEEDLRRIVGAIRRRSSIAGSRVGFRSQNRRRSILGVRSPSPNSPFLQTATPSEDRVMDENNDEDLRE